MIDGWSVGELFAMGDVARIPLLLRTGDSVTTNDGREAVKGMNERECKRCDGASELEQTITFWITQSIHHFDASVTRASVPRLGICRPLHPHPAAEDLLYIHTSPYTYMCR